MYLQDFIKIGGIFVPGKVLSTTLTCLKMRGSLELQGKSYPIVICTRKGKLTRIEKVCGSTSEEAVASKRELMEFHTYCVRTDAFGLRSFVRKRQSRFLSWVLCVVMSIFCITMSFVTYLVRGYTPLTITTIIGSILLLILCVLFKKRIIYDKIVFRR